MTNPPSVLNDAIEAVDKIDELDQLAAPPVHRDWLALLDQPLDELDQLALLEAGKRSRASGIVSALEVDCGDALLGLRLARAGARVLAVDLTPASGQRLKEAALLLDVSDNFHFHIWNSRSCQDTTPLPGAPFDLVACRHTLSYQPYAQAYTLLRRLAMMTKIGGKLFLSAYGVHSELSQAYPDEHQPVRQRFSPLAPVMAKKYGIAEPLCLFSERDLFLLLFEAGLSVVKTFTTTHGNVKAVAVRV